MKTRERHVKLISNILIILVNFAHYSVFQACLGDQSCYLMKNVACAKVNCNEINSITAILNLNDFVTD